MPHCHPIRRTLRQHGCRATPQRVVILEAMQASGRHMTAEEIHAAVRDRFPAMDLSTVYRTLRLFTRLGLLERHVLGEGRIVYEWRDRPSHGHLRCRSCHQIFHLEESVLEELRQEIQGRLGLSVEQITLSVLGLCSRCRARGSIPSEAKP